MLSKQIFRQAFGTPALAKSRHFLGSILLVGATVLSSSHITTALAAPCDQRSATAETYSVIEADFYACVLRGIAQGAAVESVEDGCLLQMHAAIDAGTPADESGSPQRGERDADWWSEF